MNVLYDKALKVMEGAFRRLTSKVGRPAVRPFGKGHIYRYRDQSPQQAIIQKLARTVTGLRAIRLLNDAGLVQEQACLQRTLHEFEEDILFLSYGITQGMESLHKKYLDAFYQEEFDNPESSIDSLQRRPMIPRKKIRAYIARTQTAALAQAGHSEFDPSTATEVMRTLNSTYSGYVHGASPQIMELYYGKPPRFHLAGGTSTPYYAAHAEDLLNYYYRGVLSFGYSAYALEDDDLGGELHEFSILFAQESGRPDHLLG